MMASSSWGGPACPVPAGAGDRIQLGHGSGGRMTLALLKEHFFRAFGGQKLELMADGAVLPWQGQELVISTDSFVVTPVEFPGGNIGDLAVNGTVNDIAMMGAEPRHLSAAFILEEGLPLAVLDRVVASMAKAAERAGVTIVAGDTKVVEKGKADGLFVTTTGVGVRWGKLSPAPHQARPGDVVLVSGPLGRHGMAVMAARGNLGMWIDVESDTAPLWSLVEALGRRVGDSVHVLRDPTRGGLAGVLNEVAAASRVGVRLEEGALPVPEAVRAACEVLGLDPLYVACEGVLVAFVTPDAASEALEVLRTHPLGREAARVGEVVEGPPGMVTLRTGFGGTRVVDLLPGSLLPRIC